MWYKARKNSLEDDHGNQILVMLPTYCSRKRVIEICKITANVLNNIEQGKINTVRVPRTSQEGQTVIKAYAGKGGGMKNLYCHKCGTLVATLAVGSKVRTDATCFCGPCYAKTEIPDFLMGLMKGKKG